jgi:hypothetical protein
MYEQLTLELDFGIIEETTNERENNGSKMYFCI